MPNLARNFILTLVFFAILYFATWLALIIASKISERGNEIDGICINFEGTRFVPIHTKITHEEDSVRAVITKQYLSADLFTILVFSKWKNENLIPFRIAAGAYKEVSTLNSEGWKVSVLKSPEGAFFASWHDLPFEMLVRKSFWSTKDQDLHHQLRNIRISKCGDVSKP